ncbi:MAG: DUF763 domain-containing protein [Methanomassiliicoccales archaeon]
MPRTGIADLPLHGGSAPRWLFERMVKLAKAIVDVIVIEYDTKEVVRRMADPFWFQAFSCVLGFDWHSSGTTTVTCGALKEALKQSDELCVAGGKGRFSTLAPADIRSWSSAHELSPKKESELVYASRMAAKVDSSAVQDGYDLYHHSFIFDREGNWTVIQQGMDEKLGYARRYHWFSGELHEFVEEPHSAILGVKSDLVLDMTSRMSRDSRKLSVDLVNEGVERLQREIVNIDKGQSLLSYWTGERIFRLNMPRSVNWNVLRKAYEFHPTNYEELLSVRGIGPSTVRALALIGELVYGAEPSRRDPVKFSFAVGGKDGVPFPVDRKAMDESIQLLIDGVYCAKLGNKEKLSALKRLRSLVPSYGYS